MTLPALLAALLFQGLRRVPGVLQPWARAGLVTLSSLVFSLSLVFAVTLLVSNRPSHLADPDLSWATQVTFHPLTLLAVLASAALAAWAEQRLENAPEFPLGLVIGETAVLATVLLQSLVLIWGGREDWHLLALLTFVIHLPLAVIEGIVLGFTVGFLARVKPEMLGSTAVEPSPCQVESLP
jgi:ABC-type Co2+ transport system permease subunit